MPESTASTIRAPRADAAQQGVIQRVSQFRATGLGVVVVALALVVGTSGSYYVINVSTRIAILYILAIAMVLLLRYSDQVSMAQAAIWGVGAYAVGIAQVHFGMNVGLSLFLATGAAAAVGLLLAIPLLRLRQHFIAMATLAFQLIFTTVVVQARGITGGSPGMVGLNPITVGGNDLFDGLFLIPAALGVLIAIFVFRNATRFRHGRAATAIRTDELMAESVGVAVGPSRVSLFVLASALTGLAGFLEAEHSLLLTPGAFDLQMSVTILAMVVIGGSGAILGPVFGVLVYYLSTQVLAQWPDYQAVLFGFVIIAVMRWMPDGVSGRLQAAWRRIFRRSEGEMAVTAIHRDSAPLVIDPPLDRPGRVDPPPGTPVLVVSDVAKSFGGVRVLTDVSFEVPPEGGVTAIIGPNGAGKSTLFNVICGIVPADAGDIRLFGDDITHSPSVEVARLGVGRSFQNPRLLDDQDCLSNVMLGAHRLESYGRVRNYAGLGLGAFERWNRRRSQEILDFLGLGAYASWEVGRLPFGARKILELGRILNMDPRLMLLDEPGAGLNDEEGAWLGSVLLDLVHESGIPLVLVDHRLDLIRQVADRAVMLHEGQMLVHGTVEEVLTDPRTEEAYIGAIVVTDEN